jgi:deoxyadenosine/deoxycytidine kinase
LLESKWDEIMLPIVERKACSAPLLAVCGPSGAGKTTVVEAMGLCGTVYIEVTDSNPHLAQLLGGLEGFDAVANQEWYLARFSEFVAQSDPELPLIVDQDPSAIVFAYARMFQRDGLMTKQNYISIVRQLLQVEKILRRWKIPRAMLFLDAPEEVLWKRVALRRREAPTPPVEWFRKLRGYFRELSERWPYAVTVSTADLCVEEVISRACDLLALADISMKKSARHKKAAAKAAHK